MLHRAGGEPEDLPSKCDVVAVEAGDRLAFITAGAGGLGDPRRRPVESVMRDVRGGLVSPEAARRDYGVALTEDLLVDEAATAELRRAGGGNGVDGAPDANVALGPLPATGTAPVAEPVCWRPPVASRTSP